MEIIKIPIERIRVLLGVNGETKKRLELLTKTSIKINDDGAVEITGESADEFFLMDVIKSIGFGFEPRDAEKLLNENYASKFIDLKEICKSKNDLKRIKGRIIGEEGKMKNEIEAATDCKISIYERTIGIIAPLDTILYTEKAINNIIDGAQLTHIFNDLAKYRREIMSNRLLGR
ncbi:MAG: KH domain-containing protein [Candidatus Micrarchaeota archaeon]